MREAAGLLRVIRGVGPFHDGRAKMLSRRRPSRVWCRGPMLAPAVRESRVGLPTPTEVRRERLPCISPFCSHRQEQPCCVVLVSPGSIESKNTEVSVGRAWARKARAGTGYRMWPFLFPFRLRTWQCVDANASPILLRTPKPMRTLRPTVASIEPDVMGRCGRQISPNTVPESRVLAWFHVKQMPVACGGTCGSPER